MNGHNGHNGHTIEFYQWNQKLENYVSPKVSLWESKGQNMHDLHKGRFVVNDRSYYQ